MRRLLPLALALSLLAPAAATAKAPRIPAGWIGVAADGPLLEQPDEHRGEWRRMTANHVGFVRAAFVWRTVQPAEGPIDLAPTDAIVLAAARQGLTVLPGIYGTPAWAAVDPADEGSAPADPSRFGAVLRAFVRRYGPAGTLWAEHPEVRRRPIRRWQVWNEQNLPAYWEQQPFAAHYVDLLRVAHAVLEQEDPRAKLVLGGMPNRSWESLREIYDAGGGKLFDAVALHPYTGAPWDVVRVVRLAHRVMARHGDRRKPIYVTELSWPASAGFKGQKEDGFHVTDRRQAEKLRRALPLLARWRKRLHIAGVVWYTWLSAEGRGLPTWAGFTGLRRVRDGRVLSAPSLKAFRQTVAALRRR